MNVGLSTNGAPIENRGRTLPSGMVQRLCREFREAGTDYCIVKTWEEAGPYISRLIKDSGAKLVVKTHLPPTMDIVLESAMKRAGVEVVSEETDHFLDVVKLADVGITSADLAIAEAGAVVLTAKSEAERLVSALPLVHVALLDGGRIVGKVEQAGKHLKTVPKESRKNRVNVVTTFIRGPSRTADIEQTIVLGVHGPHHVHVIILAED